MICGGRLMFSVAGLAASVCEWRDTVVRGDADAFARLMEECRRYLHGDDR